MNEQEIKQQVIQLLKKIAPDTEPEKLTDTENVREVLMIDSFDYLRFIVALDERFGMQTPEEDYGQLKTLGSINVYVQKKGTHPSVKEQK